MSVSSVGHVPLGTRPPCVLGLLGYRRPDRKVLTVVTAEVHQLHALPEERPVLVLDLGGQYSQLIARRVRECRVYSELVPHSVTPDQVRARNPHALILSGGPASVYASGAPRVDPALFSLGDRKSVV